MCGAMYHKNGIGVFISKEYSIFVRNFTFFSKRMLLFRLNAKPFNIYLIYVYIPRTDK